MGQITGNDKDFPTIKQVNDALRGVGDIPLIRFNDVIWVQRGVSIISPSANLSHYQALANNITNDKIVDNDGILPSLPDTFLCRINNLSEVLGENTTFLLVKQIVLGIPIFGNATYRCSGVNQNNGTYFNICFTRTQTGIITNPIITNTLTIDYFVFE